MSELTQRPFEKVLEKMVKENCSVPPPAPSVHPPNPHPQQPKNQKRRNNGHMPHKATNKTVQAPVADPKPAGVPMPLNLPPGIPMVIATPYKRVAVEALIKGSVFAGIALVCMTVLQISVGIAMKSDGKPATE